MKALMINVPMNVEFSTGHYICHWTNSGPRQSCRPCCQLRFETETSCQMQDTIFMLYCKKQGGEHGLFP